MYVCIPILYIHVCIYIHKHTYMIYIHNIEIDKYICIPIFTLFAYIYTYMHRYIYINVSLCKRCPYLGLFWSAFSRIWTKYGVSLCVLHSFRMRENSDQNSPEYGHFHAVYVYIKYMFILYI